MIPTELFQDSKLRKEIAKKYEGFCPIKIFANPRADLSIQLIYQFRTGTNLRGKKIKKSSIELFKGSFETTVSGTKSRLKI